MRSLGAFPLTRDSGAGVSSILNVEPFERWGGVTGRDFVLDDEHGVERFSARLLDGETELSVGWTDNLARTGLRLGEAQRLAGGPGGFTRIVGMASDQLEAVRAGHFDTDQAANILGRALGGRWIVRITTRAGLTGILDISAQRVED